MSVEHLLFRILYGVGFTPWEGHALPARLRAIVEGPSGLVPGKALDLGCGTGVISTYLAKNGWETTGVDFVSSALARARARSNAAGVNVRYIEADVTRLASYGIGTGFLLVNDSGCFHGLSDTGRVRYALELRALAASEAVFLLAGFLPGVQRGVRGITQDIVEHYFSADWEIFSAQSDPEVSSVPGRMIDVYELRRKSLWSHGDD